MISQVIQLTQWEWFKLRRRWMPWILLAVVVVLAQFALWFTYAAYHNESLQEFTSGGSSSFAVSEEVAGEVVSIEISCIGLANEGIPPEIAALPEERRVQFLSDVEEFRAANCGDTTLRDDLRKAFTIPNSVASSFTGMVGVTAILVVILAASIVGSEYGWGTLRPTLSRGAGRWRFLASKFALLLAACIAAQLIVAASTVVASLLAIVIPPEETGNLIDLGTWADVAISFGKSTLALAPYIALGAFLAVLTQSAAAGMAIGLGYYVVELIAAPLLAITSWGQRIADYVLGPSVNEWLQSATVTVDVSGASSTGSETDSLPAVVVILVYTFVLVAAAFWIFARRDITGARGD